MKPYLWTMLVLHILVVLTTLGMKPGDTTTFRHGPITFRAVVYTAMAVWTASLLWGVA